jgi:hypothetical protein
LACGSKEGFFSAYPALIPHPGTPGLGNIPGYYSVVPLKRDWFTEKCVQQRHKYSVSAKPWR